VKVLQGNVNAGERSAVDSRKGEADDKSPAV